MPSLAGSHARESGPVWPASEEARNFWNLARIEAGFGPFFSKKPQ